MSKKISALIFFVPVLMLCVFAGCLVLGKANARQTVVTIDNNLVTFKSNLNNEGDTYFVIVNKDTVSGVFINGRWEDVKQ